MNRPSHPPFIRIAEFLDDDGHCGLCHGRAFVPSYSAAKGAIEPEDCFACAGIATAGVFVFRMIGVPNCVRRFFGEKTAEVERRIQTADYHAALRRAGKLFRIARARGLDWVTEVRVVFKPGPDVTPYAEQIVFRVPDPNAPREAA